MYGSMKLESGQVVHFTGRPFATWGCGYIAYQAAVAAHRAGRLARVIAPSFGPSDVPEELLCTAGDTRSAALLERIPYRVRVRFGLDYFMRDNDIDWQARGCLMEGGILHGWSHQALWSMKEARRRGTRLVLERPNTHPREMRDLVRTEREKFGFRGSASGPMELWKSEEELGLAERIIVCSEFGRQSHIKHGIPDENIRVINYGVDTDVFIPGEKHDNTFRVIYCGMVCLRKGVQYLLEAWKQLGWTDAELWLLGMVNPDAVELMERYRGLPGLKVEGHVDSRVRLAELYRQGSVFVFPSVEDGFGMVVTEAMACGVPVIISDQTGAKDVVVEGVNGFITPTYDVEALKERMTQVREDEVLRRSMGLAARETALANTWGHYGEKLLKVYDELGE